MAWHDCIPVLTDELLSSYLRSTEPDFSDECDELFGVKEILPAPHQYDHVLSISLFFKPSTNIDDDFCPLTEDVLRNPSHYGLKPRYNPWDHYVKPVLDHAPILRTTKPNVGTRIYLAKDMEFLADRLNQHCEVHIMKSSSVRSAPGMLWRFLALGDFKNYVTVLDADLMPWALPKINLTERLPELSLGSWRVPVLYDYDMETQEVIYRAMAGCFFGSTIHLNMLDLLAATYVSVKSAQLGSNARNPKNFREAKIIGSTWPDYGYDEYFLTTAVFPRLVSSGFLTVAPRPNRSFFSLLDIEYVMSANSNSRVNFSLHRNLTHNHHISEQIVNC